MSYRISPTLRVALMLAALPLCAWLAVPCSSLASSKRSQIDRTPDLDETAKLLVAGTNALRKQEHRTELTESARLGETARDFASFMARTDKYGHDADGSQPRERVDHHGYEYCLVAENIA